MKMGSPRAARFFRGTRRHRLTVEATGIRLKSHREIEFMRRAGRIVALTLSKLASLARPGITTGELDGIAETTLAACKARPSFKGYEGYPATICASINAEVVHGIPGTRALHERDIVSIDLGASVEGYHADAAITVCVGEVSADGQRLLEVTKEALGRGIAEAQPGRRVSDISKAVQSYVEAHGYSVIRDLVGHGIGREMHEPPQVPNFVSKGPSAELRPGMALAIEPMVNAGGPEVVRCPDGWTFCTRDGSLAAHFEHTVLITTDGPVILTSEDGAIPAEAPK